MPLSRNKTTFEITHFIRYPDKRDYSKWPFEPDRSIVRVDIINGVNI